MAEVKAQLNNLRMAPRKVRSVVGLIKNKKVAEAMYQLDHFVRRPAAPIKKLLNSAIANAENNLNMVKDNLYIKSLIVNEGAKLKRFRAKGFGRAALIQKKTSHINIILGELKPGLRMEKSERTKKAEEHVHVQESSDSKVKKPEIKRAIGSKGNVFGGLGRKMFQRKSV